MSGPAPTMRISWKWYFSWFLQKIEMRSFWPEFVFSLSYKISFADLRSLFTERITFISILTLRICNSVPPKRKTWPPPSPPLTPFWSRECQNSCYFFPKYREKLSQHWDMNLESLRCKSVIATTPPAFTTEAFLLLCLLKRQPHISSRGSQNGTQHQGGRRDCQNVESTNKSGRVLILISLVKKKKKTKKNTCSSTKRFNIDTFLFFDNGFTLNF